MAGILFVAQTCVIAYSVLFCRFICSNECERMPSCVAIPLVADNALDAHGGYWAYAALLLGYPLQRCSGFAVACGLLLPLPPMTLFP